MTSRPPPFIGALRVPWLRPFAQVLRLVGVVAGVVGALLQGPDIADAFAFAALIGFVVWRALPPLTQPLPLRDVLAVELFITTVSVAVTGGWASPWLLSMLFALGLAALGAAPSRSVPVAAAAGVLTTVGTLGMWPSVNDLLARVATLVVIVLFAVVARGVLVEAGGESDGSLGELQTLWSVRALLEGLHTRTSGTSTRLTVDDALAAVRAASPLLGQAHVLGLLRAEEDSSLRVLDAVGLAGRRYLVRDLPAKVGDPRRDGVPVVLRLDGGGLDPDSVVGGYLWLAVEGDEAPHVLVVEHHEAMRRDELMPELVRIAQPLAVTIANIAWFQRVRHLGVDEERQRIAARLHDEFAQELAAVSMELEFAARRHPEDERLAALRRHVHHSLGGLRDTMVELRAQVSADHDLPHVLGQLVRRLTDRHGLVTDLVVAVDGTRPPIAIEQQLLRIAQELTRRAVDERRASAVNVRYELAPGHLELAVSDDGEPPTRPEVSPEAVADVLRTRIEAIGARLTTGAGPHGLAEVIVRLDLAGAAQQPPHERPQAPASDRSTR